MSAARASLSAPSTRAAAPRAFSGAASKRPCACGQGFGAAYCECGGPVAQRHPAAHEVGPVDDPLEREADRAADTVMSGGNVKRIDGRLAGASRAQRSAVYTHAPVGSSGRIKTGKLVDWDYVVYADHVRLGNRVFDTNTKQVIGTWPWLTNNPGDITVDPKEAGKSRSNLNRAYEWGAVAGQAASTGHVPLAVFPDGATGAAALKKLYAEPEYRDKTLKAAIEVHLGRTESRVPGVDDPKKYLEIVKDRARKLGFKDDVLNQTLAELDAAGAMDALVEGFGAAEGYENVGITYTCDGRDKTDDAKIPQTVRNLGLFKNLPDQAPDEVLRLLGCKVPSGDGGKAQKKAAELEALDEDEAAAATDRDASIARAVGLPGSPLPAAVRRLMENRFGHDFSRVRVHVDATAQASARRAGARAYTVGQDIVFADGQFVPHSQAGQRLLAHELAHVVQQTRPGPPSATAALESEARSVGEAVTSGRPVTLAHAAPRNAVQHDSEPDGEPAVIAKENGMVAVVIMSGGKIAKGLAEIRPPPGMSAQEAAGQVQVARGGPSGKVDVIVPPGWGRQTINPAAKSVRVIDTKIMEGEQQKAEVDAQITELRDNYRQYRNEVLIAAGMAPDAPGFAGADALDAIAADEGFLKWVQRKQRARDYQDFAAQNQELGLSAEQTKDAWKFYRQPGLDKLQADITRLQGLKYRTEQELKSTDPKTESLLFGWLAGNPQPVQIAAGDDKTKVYLFGLPDGDVVSLSEEQFRRLRKVAGDKLEIKLNTVQNQKGLYEFHKNDRGAASKALDYVYGADLEGKTWKEIDDSIATSRKALAAGDFDASLKAYGDATQQGYVAQREWERYLHRREVGAEVTITGLEVVKAGAQITIAIGTMQPELAGLSGLAIATGANVTETVALAAVKSADQHVDWGDVGFEVTAQVVTAAVTHGVAEIAPNSAIMNTIRSGLDTPIVGDALQAIVVDSATFAVRQEFERARGRGEHLTAAQMKEHFFKFVSDPESMPKQVLEAATVRYLGSRVKAYRAGKAQAGAPGASPGEQAPSEAPQGRAAPDRAAAPPADLAAPQGLPHGADTPPPGAPGAEHPAPASAGPPAPPPASAPPANAEPRLTVEVAPLQRESGGNAGKPPAERPAPAAAAAAPGGPAKRSAESGHAEPAAGKKIDPAIPDEAISRIEAEPKGEGAVPRESRRPTGEGEPQQHETPRPPRAASQEQGQSPARESVADEAPQAKEARRPSNRDLDAETRAQGDPRDQAPTRDVARERQDLQKVLEKMKASHDPVDRNSAEAIEKGLVIVRTRGELVETQRSQGVVHTADPISGEGGLSWKEGTRAIASRHDPVIYVDPAQPGDLAADLRHEVNHALHSSDFDSGARADSLSRYRDEFRAHWAEGDHNAESVRQKILANYDKLAAEYGENPAFKERVDLITRPDGNVVNSPRLEPVYGAIDHWEMSGEQPSPEKLKTWFDAMSASDKALLANDGRFRRWFHEQLVLPAAERTRLLDSMPLEASQRAPAPPGDEGRTPHAVQVPGKPASGDAKSSQGSGPDRTPSAPAESGSTSRSIDLKRGTVEPWRKSRTGDVHDLGRGTYYTLDQSVARQYAVERRLDYLKEITAPGETKLPSAPPGIVLETKLDREGVKVFDFYSDPALRSQWEGYLRKFGPAGERILSGHGAAEHYNSFFEGWMKSKSLSPGDYDVIIGPEYRNAGSQVCVRDAGLVEKIDNAARVTEIATDAPSGAAKP